MKQIFIIISILVVLPLLSTGQQQRWETTIGRADISETFYDNVKTYDNGYCLLNYQRTGMIYLVKTDINGSILWNKTFINQQDNFHPRSIAESSNNELVIAGALGDYGFVMKLNTCGDVLWCSRFINPEYNLIIFNEIVTLDNGNIILLSFMQRIDGDRTNQVYLFCYDAEGNFLWKKPYASLSNHPLFGDRLVYQLYHFDNYFIAVGSCYYPYPDNPSLLVKRPFFIRIDSAYNEVFVLPYGVEDSIVGWAHHLKNQDNNNINTAAGTHFPHFYSGERNALIMSFDSSGNETNYWGVPNEDIGNDVIDNIGRCIIQVTDSTEIITGPYGSDYTVNPIGELLVNTNHTVINTLSHPNTIGSTADIIKTTDSTFLFTTSQMELPSYSYNNILLYKLNADLSQAAYDPSTHVYDSLCDYLPIISDTIYIDNCSIVTSTVEDATPYEYYSSLKTININVTPNPATDAIAFEIESSEFHNNLVLTCYDVVGKKVFVQDFSQNKALISTNVTNWLSGLYFAVVTSNTGAMGSKKFVVR